MAAAAAGGSDDLPNYAKLLLNGSYASGDIDTMILSPCSMLTANYVHGAEHIGYDGYTMVVCAKVVATKARTPAAPVIAVFQYEHDARTHTPWKSTP